MADHVLGFLVKGVSKSIAISSELIAGQKGKDSKQAREDSLRKNSAYAVSSDDEDATQKEWIIDEVEGGLEETQYPGEVEDTSTQKSAAFLDRIRTVPVPDIKPLPQAVLIPQRRPGDRRRGFILAYAPALADSKAIDEATFLELLANLNLATQASKIFDVINLACFGIGFIPSSIAVAVSATVGTASMVAQILQMRYRTNKYLDKINEQYFQPRNCYAMIVTYKPEMADDLFLQADTTSTTAIAISKVMDENSKSKRLLARLKASAGTTNEAQMPECAPLVHPGLDKALVSTSLTEQKKSFLSEKQSIVNDYLDRRAQTDFVTRNPTSKISQALPPQKQYVNRFADPDHPVNAGSVFALLTGGNFDPIATGRVRRAEAHAKKNNQPSLTDAEKHDAYMGRKVRGRVTGTPSKSIPVIGKMLKKDVLYLLIVELPSEEEMRQTAAMLAEAERSG